MTLTTITLENLDNLQVDDANRLYWMGDKIITDMMINLPGWVEWAGGITAILVAVYTAMLIGERFHRWFGG